MTLKMISKAIVVMTVIMFFAAPVFACLEWEHEDIDAIRERLRDWISALIENWPLPEDITSCSWLAWLEGRYDDDEYGEGELVCLTGAEDEPQHSPEPVSVLVFVFGGAVLGARGLSKKIKQAWKTMTGS